MKSFSLLASCLVVVAASVAACNEESGGKNVSVPAQKATVSRVVDGDTIKVKIGGVEKSVRLIGIDTPETHKPGVKVECGGKEAAANMTSLAPEGAAVRLVSDPTQDKVDRYGRMLAYASVHGRSLQLEQIYAGNAKVYVYGGKPFARVDKFRRAEGVAERAKRGVWGHCSGDFHSEDPEKK